MKINRYFFKNLIIPTLYSVLSFQNVQGQLKNHIKAKQPTTDNYTYSYIKGNYVWGGAMSLAWSNLNKNIIKAPIKLNTNDKKAISIVEKLNHPPFTKNDLDEKSYYIKSGFGNNTIATINLETKKKFPKKSFQDLKENLKDKDFIAFAYFYKKLTYLNSFSAKTTTFLKTNVASFYAENEKQKENISVINYVDDDHFIVSLELKNNNDQIILAKGYNMVNPSEIISYINNFNWNELTYLKSRDEFEAPKISLDMYRDYKELVGKNFKNRNFENYRIDKMYEKIKFNMDENGAKVENEAVIEMTTTAVNPIYLKQPRRFVLDKPYWILMKRSNSKNPYFILGINNANLMEIKK